MREQREKKVHELKAWKLLTSDKLLVVQCNQAFYDRFFEIANYKLDRFQKLGHKAGLTSDRISRALDSGKALLTLNKHDH